MVSKSTTVLSGGPVKGAQRRATNLTISSDVRAKASVIAATYYDCSLSSLVERLLENEIRLAGERKRKAAK